MKSYCFTLSPMTPFASPLVGDSLFGHLCWTVKNGAGEQKLTDLLDGYTDGRPFAVISDAIPAGLIPRPTVPMRFFSEEDDPSRRKQLKRKQWLPVEVLKKPFDRWLEDATAGPDVIKSIQPHNTINRLTGTTGTGQFAPYTVEQTWHREGAAYRIYVCLDEDRLAVDELAGLLASMGASGFGRDASVGLGKFDVSPGDDSKWPDIAGANACLTLACCAPQGMGFDADHSFYEVTTRFGRHGDVAALSGVPYKNPILMASRGAVFTPPQYGGEFFIGQGIGGNGMLSVTLPDTVHQGYAPVIPILLPLDNGGQR